MGLIDTLLTAPEPLPATAKSLDALAQWLGLEQRTAAGVTVTEHTALRMSTVYACVRLMAETVASLPLRVFRERAPGAGKELMADDPRAKLLAHEWNPQMSSFTARETLVGHVNLWGNGYAWIERGRAGKIVGLWPLRPDKIKVQKQSDRSLLYTYEDDAGRKMQAPGSSILHFPGLGFDGISGYSPVGLMKQAIGMALAAEDFGSRFFSNSAMPSGVLSTPGQLSEDAVERLRTRWQQMQGGENRWRTAVLEDGLTWTAIGMKPDEAQFLQIRDFQAADLARAWRIPPWMIGLPIQGRGITYATVEQQGIAFVVHTLRPTLVRFEQELKRKLFPEPDLCVEFDADALLRGDIKSRFDAYAVANGSRAWLTVNEIRLRENLNPVEGGDDLIEPEALTPGADTETPLDAEGADPEASAADAAEAADAA